MPRKVFLSFLGTSFYNETYYIADGQREEDVRPTRFVQEATIRNFCQEFSKNDKIYIFTTEKALENWADNEHYNRRTEETVFYKGLESCLRRVELDCLPENVLIKNGSSTEELWDIFKTVFDKIEDKDEITFDITHGFRTLPMFNMVLINYAKLLKNIEVKGIYYGAFEAKKTRLDGKEFSPIWDLKDFDELQDWTMAGNLFMTAGYVDNISQLIETSDSEFSRKIEEVSQMINTNRGLGIVQGEPYLWTKEYLESKQKTSVPVLKPILNKIEHRFENYKLNEPLNLLEATRWCIDHKLIQQGYTLISEFLPTYILSIVNYDLNNKTYRNAVNGFLSIGGKLEKFNFSDKLEIKQSQEELLIKVKEVPYLKKLCKRNRSINAENRDDINHGGFRVRPKKYLDLSKELEDKFSKLVMVVEKIEDKFKEDSELLIRIRNTKIEHNSLTKRFLLNLSNHPSANWPQIQKNAAIKTYGNMEDMPFPQIDPECDEGEIDQLVEEYANKIKKLKPEAVHIMGEMTFTYRLVKRLKETGVLCIASTTERIATEDGQGNKTSAFRFIKFRKY